MYKIHVQSVLHRGVRRIKLEFQYDPDINRIVKAIDGVKWSTTKRCWHIPYSDRSFQFLDRMIQEQQFEVPEFKALCEEREYKYFDKKVSSGQESSLKDFKEYLEVQRYSSRTIDTYVKALKVFMSYTNKKEIDQLSCADLIDFNYNYVVRNRFSSSYQNQIISAIKLFYNIQLGIEADFNQIERPIRGRPLPEVFSVQEVERLLKSIRSLKGKVMLSLIYACGLRRSELINLRLNSIDSDRKMLKVVEAKGNKDRLVPLPESLIEKLREYYKAYRPLKWLFEGNERGKQYSATSLREFFIKAKKSAGLTKKLTLHSLRHSYATHLLENGVDLRFIQEMLGHKSSKTTEIYTHVTTKSIEKIRSPFENLKL